MRVILQKDLKNVGKAGQIIKVKKGFARNFLFPKSLALLFTDKNQKQKEHYQKVVEKKKKKADVLRGESLERLSKVSLKFKMPVNEEGALFGSLTAAQIASELNKKDFEVGKKDVLLNQPIKALGEYEVEVQLSSDKKTKIKVLLESL